MSDSPTWFVFPDTDFVPDGEIQLGQLITDRRCPYARLAPPINKALPGTTEIPGKGRQFRSRRSIQLETDLNAKILSFITVGVSFLFVKRVVHRYKITKDTTYQFVPERDSTYLDATIHQEDERVRSEVRKGKTMYMIVGIKVSHEATVTHQTNNIKGLEGKVDVPVDLNGDGVGGRVEVQKESGMWDHQDKLEHDFVYAYRLKKCVRQGKGYKLREKFEISSASELFSTGSASTESEDFVEYRLAPDDSDGGALVPAYEDVDDEVSDADKGFRAIILEEKPPAVPTVVRIAAILGVAFYCLLFYCLYRYVVFCYN